VGHTSSVSKSERCSGGRGHTHADRAYRPTTHHREVVVVLVGACVVVRDLARAPPAGIIVGGRQNGGWRRAAYRATAVHCLRNRRRIQIGRGKGTRRTIAVW
jgi:hypothetical protein